MERSRQEEDRLVAQINEAEKAQIAHKTQINNLTSVADKLNQDRPEQALISALQSLQRLIESLFNKLSAGQEIAA